MAPLIEQMARFHRNEKRNDYGDTLLELAVTQLIVALGYHTGKTPDATIGIKNKKVLEIMQYIQRHISESIQIEEIAVNMKISSRCVRKHFAEEVGMSCSDYITMLRMNKAKKMLWETERTITEIAMETGYGTPQYFSRVFKNEMGMAPSAYRTSWREEK